MSTRFQILVGLLFTLLTGVPLATIAVNDFGIVPSSEPMGLERRAAARRGREIEMGAETFARWCAGCHGVLGEGIPQVAPALARGDLLDGRRARAIGWTAGTDALIRHTIVAGRPIPSRPDLYAARMPAWGSEFGGALGAEQVNALVAFILNWRVAAPEVNAFPPLPPTVAATRVPALPPTPTPRVQVLPVCQMIPAPYAGAKAPFPSDDKAVLASGKQIYEARCAACHGNTGKGDGPAAAALNPKPANLTDKAFMRMLPVDCHLYVIAEGVKGTGMPPWKSLGNDALWKVLIYTRAFSGTP